MCHSLIWFDFFFFYLQFAMIWAFLFGEVVNNKHTVQLLIAFNERKQSQGKNQNSTIE